MLGFVPLGNATTRIDGGFLRPVRHAGGFSADAVNPSRARRIGGRVHILLRAHPASQCGQAALNDRRVVHENISLSSRLRESAPNSSRFPFDVGGDRMVLRCP